MKRIAVLGGAGFVGSHLCARLVAEGNHVIAYDRKLPEFGWYPAHEHIQCDLREPSSFMIGFIARRFDECYQLAAEMGGAGYVFTGSNDADIMANSARINLNTIDAVRRSPSEPRVFFSSSACVYGSMPATTISDVRGAPTRVIGCREDHDVAPDSDYGFEKLFSEKLYDAFHRNYGIDVRIGRLHNVFGPYGTWRGGREKAPAALCRKIAELPREGGEVEIWGTGQQTRSFLYVDEAVDGIIRLTRSDHAMPLNIGSSESVTIAGLAYLIADIAGKAITLKTTPGPVGVDGRNSDNTLISHLLGWKPTARLVDGLKPTYEWIAKEVDKAKLAA